VRVLPGPDAPRLGGAALEALLSGTFTVSPLGDRVGRRLAGPRIRHADGAAGGSSPMVRGAIQVPPSGEPIVLGPDHPTLGGYPVLAVVARVDLGRLGARRPGDAVRFQQVDLEDARRSWQALAADFFPPQGACQERGVS
jgi:allophanate hydrolase subunit 2